MVRKATGASYPAVSDRIILKLKISLPPIAEQKRIAAILDKAEELRGLRRRALSRLDAIAQSIFLEMFGDPVTNPKGFQKILFGEVCETRLGKMLDQKKQTGQQSRVYLRNANVQWFRFDLAEVLKMDFDDTDRKTLRLQYGDLMICEGERTTRTCCYLEK